MDDNDALNAIEQTERWARTVLETYPHDPLCHHALEQLATLRRAIAGNAAAREEARERFDLGMMAAKNEEEIEDEEALDNLHNLQRYVDAL